MIVEGMVEPMELAHLPYRKATFEDYVGIRGLKRLGKKRWRRCVEDVVKRLTCALVPDDVVIGGGNVKKLKELPAGARAGDNDNAFVGGFRLWQQHDSIQPDTVPTQNAGRPIEPEPPAILEACRQDTSHEPPSPGDQGA
jgi:polyphosphate glucokinase